MSIKNTIKNWVLCSALLAALPITVTAGNKAEIGVVKDFKVTSQLASRDQAVRMFEGEFFRDPYIYLGPDDYYYLTGTRRHHLSGGSKKDWTSEGVELWRSKDLSSWELLAVPRRLGDLSWVDGLKAHSDEVGKGNARVWAPEIHFINDKWVIVHTTSVRKAMLYVADKAEGPYVETELSTTIDHKHDPSFFHDDDGKVYLTHRVDTVVEMTPDFNELTDNEFKVKPANRKMGHEGLYLTKVNDRYVIFGTAWSTDKIGRGSYNMYYATATDIRGPYSDRRYMGRFLGHGTPFQDREGQWWTTAFQNGKTMDFNTITKAKGLEKKKYTVFKDGIYLVPLELTVKSDGDVFFTPLDSRLVQPGPEEVQKF
ncbi:family 43 glycosylhydrolase [Echinimonas agarilytica]|uniref:Family 43 glycosylhydrolase n=1 Tax=Echinimonas agarilytica TaxID=1215918 RepID=A0AA41W4F6_9GAMM|nr:family 43 glycosylhydrolase [Echinimonas agarilytica]MCM2678717.1 family 43 glycosylhydrolase [Echinimonas agarilytica]